MTVDKLSPVSNMASSRSEENVNLKYFQHKWCHSVGESCNFMDSYIVVLFLADVIANDFR